MSGLLLTIACVLIAAFIWRTGRAGSGIVAAGFLIAGLAFSPPLLDAAGSALGGLAAVVVESGLVVLVVVIAGLIIMVRGAGGRAKG